MKFDLMPPADQLVIMMERIYGYGMTTTSGGNLSILDDNGDIWITPGSVDKGSLTRDDMVCIKKNGDIIGKHKPSSEFPFHKKLYEARSDIKAVLHAHPPALVAFSVVRKIPDTKIIANVNRVCGPIGLAKYGLPGSTDLGDKIADEFKKDENIHTVLLENHGVVIGHKDLFTAFKAFETIEYCARLNINSNIIGEAKALSKEQIKLEAEKLKPQLDEFVPKSHSTYEKEERAKMATLIRRGYKQRLFTSTQGTFSQRIDNDSFIITPHNIDRMYLDPADIVTIKSGMKEAGKEPSRSVLLHKLIYDTHPEINSLIIAHPHNVMAFALTNAPFDSRTIPESYIMLRDVPKVPFGSTFSDSEKLANTISMVNPVVLVENDCVLVAGNSLINAFDRLEVTEYTAKSIISSAHVGEIVKISKKQVEEIDLAFNLEK
ncbi:MAG: class II aldolase/adducin family protein [Clostridia bacterium]|nr:class II aldolase/adducin family protein [Clostridia bacterium]